MGMTAFPTKPPSTETRVRRCGSGSGSEPEGPREATPKRPLLGDLIRAKIHVTRCRLCSPMTNTHLGRGVRAPASHQAGLRPGPGWTSPRGSALEPHGRRQPLAPPARRPRGHSQRPHDAPRPLAPPVPGAWAASSSLLCESERPSCQCYLTLNKLKQAGQKVSSSDTPAATVDPRVPCPPWGPSRQLPWGPGLCDSHPPPWAVGRPDSSCCGSTAEHTGRRQAHAPWLCALAKQGGLGHRPGSSRAPWGLSPPLAARVTEL